jgi:thiamine-monophosphate kinase
MTNSNSKERFSSPVHGEGREPRSGDAEGSRQRIGEFELIAKYFAPLAEGSPGALGLTDDAGYLRIPPGHEVVATVDALVEGVHFLRHDPPETIGAKALRVNLSDLAAKSAVPAGYLLALSLPPWVDERWIAHFASGLSDDQLRFAISLLGGDTTATPGPLVISITALGHVIAGKAVHRSGARAGDAVFVTGTIGDAGAGLELLRGNVATAGAACEDALITRYRLPQPRVDLGHPFGQIATAALDVSDGLIADLNHISQVSRVRIVVHAAQIPLSRAFIDQCGDNLTARVKAATAGDDYEIAFTASPQAQGAIAVISAETGIPITEIGRVEAGHGVVLLDERGKEVPVARGGWQHF